MLFLPSLPVSLLHLISSLNLILDDITTGASQDIKQATAAAKAMVTKYGFSEKFAITILNNIADLFIDCGSCRLTISFRMCQVSSDKHIIRIIMSMLRISLWEMMLIWNRLPALQQDLQEQI